MADYMADQTADVKSQTSTRLSSQRAAICLPGYIQPEPSHEDDHILSLAKKVPRKG